MKPKSKGETKWSYWREEMPRDNNSDKFQKWAKTQMVRARRRYNKIIKGFEYD